MPRRPRFVLPGAPHHVTQRGNNRQAVFFSDSDRNTYLQMLRRYSQRHDFRVLGWCLMTNHVHLIAVPGSTQSLALTLAQTHSQYSLEMNRLQGRVGHLWQNRFFSCTLDPSHLLTAIRYVDLNPVRAGMMARAVDWHWSSARAHTSAHGRDELLEWPWISWLKEARLGHWDSADWVTSLSMAVPAGDLERVRRATRLGEPLGSDAFVEELEAKAGRRLRVGPQGRPHAEKKAAAADGS